MLHEFKRHVHNLARRRRASARHTRALAGEPFFINTFRNLGVQDGYIAVGGLEPSDKIAVIDLKDDTKHDILCARDSYMCSRRVTSESLAAAALRTTEKDFDSLLDMLRYRVGFAARLVLSKRQQHLQRRMAHRQRHRVHHHFKGTVVRRSLKEGEEMVVDARAVMALERSVGYDLEIQSSPLAASSAARVSSSSVSAAQARFPLQSLPAQQQLDSAHRRSKVKGKDPIDTLYTLNS